MPDPPSGGDASARNPMTSPCINAPVVGPQPGEGRGKLRVLFFAEAVTLAHVTRPVVLARGLDPARFEVTLASEPRYHTLWREPRVAVRPIHSIPAERFLEALARGRPLYDVDTLRAYVREDLEVIRDTAPDVVVGDFRLSLSVSARVAKVPYLAIVNAYWSPYAHRRFPMPELPITKTIGVACARPMFHALRPLAFAHHARPLGRVRREFGLPGLGPDLRRTYTDADHVLYADASELVPTRDLPANHHYLGPILWSPDVTPPHWWDDLPRDRPILYVTLGSSGRAGLLSAVLEALADLPVTVVAATLGRGPSEHPPRNAWLADFLPGQDAASRASLVICNGGSPTVYQALAAGAPVLGLASNMDQHLNMATVQQAGAGVLLRSEHARPARVRAAVIRILDEPSYEAAASRLARALAGYDAPRRFQDVLTRPPAS